LGVIERIERIGARTTTPFRIAFSSAASSLSPVMSPARTQP
jgi:hypothetical protein